MNETALRTDTVKTRIKGYDVELEFFVEGGEQRCFGVVTYRREACSGPDITYSGSIELLYGYGWLDCDDSRDGPWQVPDKIIDRITAWAQDNGY